MATHVVNERLWQFHGHANNRTAIRSQGAFYAPDMGGGPSLASPRGRLDRRRSALPIRGADGGAAVGGGVRTRNRGLEGTRGAPLMGWSYGKVDRR
jgi:hypothetical protein